MSLNYPRYPIAITRGEGCRLYDTEDREYIDLFAGFGASVLGHCHPDLIQAVHEQSTQLWHVGNLLHTEPQTRAAEAIARYGFGGRSFFSHSGADANEAAIKLARLYGRQYPGPRGPRHKVISMSGSFHGRSFGTMPATGEPKVREGFEPLPAGFVNVPYDDADAVENAIDDEVVAVLVEPIQGEGGIRVPGPSYLPDLRKLCDRRDLLLICDEVWTGAGRTGRFFGYQHWDIEPDMMTLGKGVGGGLPVGVMCARDNVAALYDARQQGGVKHATTLGGNCLAMAAAATVFEVIDRDRLLSHAVRLGDHAVHRLQQLADRIPAIKEIRGKALFIGVDLDIRSGDTWFDQVGDVVGKCLERGVMVNGTQQSVLRLAPPLVIDEELLDAGLDVIEDVIAGVTGR